MKKANVTVSYDEEKLAALRLYLEQKGLTVEGELRTAVEALYAKAVPGNVREFLDLRRGGTAGESERRRRPAVQAPEGCEAP